MYRIVFSSYASAVPVPSHSSHLLVTIDFSHWSLAVDSACYRFAHHWFWLAGLSLSLVPVAGQFHFLFLANPHRNHYYWHSCRWLLMLSVTVILLLTLLAVISVKSIAVTGNLLSLVPVALNCLSQSSPLVTHCH